jgi:Zn-dependent protease
VNAHFAAGLIGRIAHHGERLASAPHPEGRRFGAVGALRVRVARSWWLLLLCTSGLIVAVESLTLRLPLPVAVVLALGFAATLFLITIVHEAGHVIVGARLGLRPTEIRLSWLGGAACFASAAERPGQQALSLAAGPGANLALGLLVALAAFLPLGQIWQIGCWFLAALSILYGLLNLVPIYPQDGGQLLQAVLWKLTADPTRARRITSTLSVWLASIVLAAGFVVAVRVNLIPGLLVAAQALFLIRANARWAHAPSVGPRSEVDLSAQDVRRG